MRKIKHVLKETSYLIREHKLYFISPLLILLCLIVFLFIHMGPSLLIAFIYAGV